MTYQLRLERDNLDREKIKNRCKRAPMTGIISARNALAAWQNFQKYRSLADSAYSQYMRAGIGTGTQRKHLVRWEGYSDVADEWETLLDSWFKNEARIEGGK